MAASLFHRPPRPPRMDCPECGAPMVAFDVPPVASDAAPGEVAAICTTCLALVEADAADASPDFSTIIEAFPGGEAGAVMAVAVGLLVESMVLNRETIAGLLEDVSDRGEDPWLVLERLHASPTIRSGTDIGRARTQLEQLLDG